MPQSNASRVSLTTLAALSTLLTAVVAAGQSQGLPQSLLPNQSVERQLSGGEAHRYGLDLKEGEFFQAHVQQKGVDVILKLLDAGGGTLATMDSPNGKEGPETITFVASRAGAYTLEVRGLDEKAGSGTYTLRRKEGRAATAKDRRRVESEHLFVTGMAAFGAQGGTGDALEKLEAALAGWREVGDAYLESLTSRAIRLLKAKPNFEAAVALFNEGKAQSYREASAKFEAARRVFHEESDKGSEAWSLLFLGVISDKLGDKGAALSRLEQALALFRNSADRDGTATALNQLGSVYDDLGERRKALDYYEQSLQLARGANDKAAEARALNNIGKVYADMDENQRALEYYNQALALRRAEGDKGGEALTLLNMGKVYDDLGEMQKALDLYGRAQQLYGEKGDRLGVAAAFHNSGRAYLTLGDPRRALDSLNRALPVFREVGDKGMEAAALSGIGVAYGDLGEVRKALEYHNRALPLRREVGDEDGEAATLNNIGHAYLTQDENQRALEYFNQALELYKEVSARKGEATTLNNMGVAYSSLGDVRKALDYYTRALLLRREAGDRDGEATSLNNIALLYDELGEKEKALEFLNLALPLFRLVGNKSYEALVLNNLGKVHADLGQRARALDYYDRALPLFRAASNKRGEALALTNVGATYVALGERRKALEYFNRALPLHRAVGNRASEALTLNNIANVYGDLGDRRKALDYLGQALALNRAVASKGGEATALNNIAHQHYELGDKRKALEHLHQALPLFNAVGHREGEAKVLSNLAYVWDARGNPRLAVFYGKQAVNKYQELRHDIRGLGRDTQNAYLGSVGQIYRKLSDMLIAEGRIIEAEQVLAMLKEDEVFGYLRRDASESDNLQQRADLRPEERDALRRYTEIADRIAALGAEYGALQEQQRKGVKLAAEQESRFADLSAQIEDASRAFQVFLRQLAEEFARRPAVGREIEEDLALQADLRSWGEGVVFLYTLAGEDRYRVILVTPDTQVDGKSEIEAADLNAKIEKFRAAVQDPSVDPRPLGKELYDILVKPVERQLEGARAKTLLWSLDGNLRLLPLAALWDGEQYFGQKYQNVTVTLASRARLGDAVAPDWRALGLGVTEGRQVKEPNSTRELTFKSLPAVREELRAIVRSEESPGGVLPGQSLLDAEFSEGAFESQLRRGYAVVHIASHFSLNPGDSTRSFLLLGDGNVLTVDAIKNRPGLSFRGVELLTLSACQTAVVEKDDSGKEIEGFGYVAQRKGAKAILATLWSVVDESTSLLMSEFYRLRKENPQMTKAAALQHAQRAMLEGKLSPSAQGGANGRGAELAGEPVGRRQEFRFDRSKPYAHPYYWAPFVLIGNWK